jgi:hypothetical protein
MKVKNLLPVRLFLLAAVIVVASCATMKKSISEEDFFTIWSGTWINTDYAGTHEMPQKIVTRFDSTMEIFNKVDDTERLACGRSKITLTDKCIDAKGEIWYKAGYRSIPSSSDVSKGYLYGQVNKFGTTMDFLESFETIPMDEWDPDNNMYYYRIYYRQ